MNSVARYLDIYWKAIKLIRIPTNHWLKKLFSLRRFAADAEEISSFLFLMVLGPYWSEATYFALKLCIIGFESMLEIFAQVSRNSEVADVCGHLGRSFGSAGLK